MKKLLSLLLVIVVLSTGAIAFSDTLTQEEIQLQAQQTKIQEIESSYNVAITVNGLATAEDLQVIEATFKALHELSEAQKNTYTIRTVRSINGSYSFSHVDPVVGIRVPFADNSGYFELNGHQTIEGTLIKNVSNGKVYLSGNVSKFIFDGLFSGMYYLLSGSLNISGNGTTTATWRPSAEVQFVVSSGTTSGTGRYTFYSSQWTFETP